VNIKEITTAALIKRVRLFEDSEEVAAGLWTEAKWFEEVTGEYAYYAKEGATQIEGMWELLRELRNRLEISESKRPFDISLPITHD
jgi:hypothetical protein